MQIDMICYFFVAKSLFRKECCVTLYRNRVTIIIYSLNNKTVL